MLLKLNLGSHHEVIATVEDEPGEHITLVHLPNNPVTPYATYRVIISKGLCLSGDYLHTTELSEAVQAWLQRAGFAD